MTTNFMKSSSYLFASESVTEGHPDKICDQVSDGILDAILAKDPYARVACEVATTTGLVVIMGEITCDCYIELSDIARQVIRDIGYTNPDYGFDYEGCGIMVSVKEQSRDIAMGVDESWEIRKGASSDDDIDKQGAGDQGIMFGFACNETPEFMPLTHSLASKLARRLALVRKNKVLPYLRPDGKSQVAVEYHHGVPHRVDSVTIAAQHDPDISQDVLQRDIIKEVIKTTIPSSLLDKQTKYYINATGRFVIGGPVGDTGLTGRKILVDTYGGTARHGGGAFSGKDPTKVDRSATYAARYVAKNVVAAGLADRLEIQLCYSIGTAHPLSVSIETFGTARVDEELILKLIKENFDLRPAAIIRDLDLRRPIYRPTSAYGHFGRDDLNLPWEKTDKAAALRAGAGIST